MQSPYMNGSQGEFYGTPQGMASLLLQRNNLDQQAVQEIGRFAGGVGAGVVGAVQGGQNPQAFGDGTTPTAGALAGGLMNFNNAYSGGGGGGGSGFAGLVNGGGGGSGGPGLVPGGGNFKQFAAAGKAADGMRETIKLQTPSLPDTQPAVMGYTDDQWKHLGTVDKVSALQSYQQQQTAKSAMLGYDTAMQHFAAAAQQMKAQQDATDADARYNKGYTQLTQPVQTDAPGEIGDPTRPVQDPMVNMAAQSIQNPAPLNGSEMMRLAAQSGMNPQTGLTISREALNQAKAAKDLKAGDEDNVPQRVMLGDTPVIYNKKGGNFQIDPSYTVAQKAAAAKDLLTQRLGGLSTKDQLASLDRQEKILTSTDALVMFPEAERASKLAAVQDQRKELLAAKPNAGSPGVKRVSVTGPAGQTGTVVEGDKLPAGWRLQ